MTDRDPLSTLLAPPPAPARPDDAAFAHAVAASARARVQTRRATLGGAAVAAATLAAVFSIWPTTPVGPEVGPNASPATQLARALHDMNDAPDEATDMHVAFLGDPLDLGAFDDDELDALERALN